MDNIDLTDKVLLALQYVEELTNKKKRSLLERVDDPSELCLSAARSSVVKILGEDKAREFFDNCERADGIIAELQKRDIHWITYLNDNYPEKLAQIYDSPLVLFVKGNTAALDADSIAVVGTRRPSRYGVRVATEFTREFAKAGLVVVSGFARGVDGIAHRTCIDNGCPTVAVFACGLDVCYPAEHRGLIEGILQNGGAIISEYPLGTKPLQYHFPERNRIISGLARAVFLPEAAKKSGSLITMRLANEQGRDLFIAPGNIYSEESAGSNELLIDMPHALVISPENVLDAMRVKRTVVKEDTVELSLIENQIVDALHDDELHFEELLSVTATSVGELTNALFNLELNGIVQKTGGNYYALS